MSLIILLVLLAPSFPSSNTKAHVLQEILLNLSMPTFFFVFIHNNLLTVLITYNVPTKIYDTFHWFACLSTNSLGSLRGSELCFLLFLNSNSRTLTLNKYPVKILCIKFQVNTQSNPSFYDSCRGNWEIMSN